MDLNVHDILVVDVLLPIVGHVIHQLWTNWNKTRVSSNSSQITKRFIAVLAILDSHFVTAFMNQTYQYPSSKSRASSRANAFTNVGLMFSQRPEPSVCLSS